MENITLDRLLFLLSQYGTAVHCEMYNYYRCYFDGGTPGLYYERGCAVTEEEYDYNGRRTFSYNIHQVSPDADIEAVAAEWKAKCEERAKNYENPVKWVVMFFVSNGALTPEWDKCLGWRNYSRAGGQTDCDERVRRLTDADAEIIRELCLPCSENDTAFGRQLANTFLNLDFEDLRRENISLLGIFDGGSLVGLADSSYAIGLKLAWLRNIFIAPDHRKMGYGKALAASALSGYPDVKWHYQAAKHNAESVALAKSLGFSLEGAGLFL